MKNKSFKEQYPYSPSIEVPMNEIGNFYAYFYNLLGERDDLVEQYIEALDQSEKQQLITEMKDIENQLCVMREKAIIWNMQGNADWEVVRKYRNILPPFKHSKDYRIVYHWGKKYILTPLQTEIIKILYEAYKEDIYELSTKEIVDELKINQIPDRLSDVFKGNQKAWKNLISYRKDRKGIYSLKSL